MRTIINLRSTHGGGKSSAVRSLINHFQGTPMLTPTGKIWAYNLQDRVFVLGRYETPTGGCDGIRTQAEIYAGIRDLAARGSVVFEGVLISCMYAQYRQLEDELKPSHSWIWACLDTPLELCIEQTIKRRTEKGNLKPFNADGLRGKFNGVLSTKKGLLKDGRDVRTLPHLKTLPYLLWWLGEGPNPEPQVIRFQDTVPMPTELDSRQPK